jgi:hypothetical protein
MLKMYSVLLSLFILFATSVMASPQWGGGRGSFEGSGFSQGNQPSGTGFSQRIDLNSPETIHKRHVLIAHAVMATTAWAFFFPIGSIFLRLNINHPIMLKLHIYTQILSYIVYAAAAGLGIWLAIDTSKFVDIWSDPHPIIGLIILVFATLQPFTGWIHHRIYRARAVILANTHRGPRPGRTIWGRIHLWTGRILITLGIINGGLGLRIMERSPTQDHSLTRSAEIGYSIGAGLMWCIYVFITLVSEGTRSARKRKQVFESSRMRRREKSQSSSSSSSLEPGTRIPN